MRGRRAGRPCEAWQAESYRRLAMAAAIKYVEKALTVAAGAAWALFSSANRIAPRRAFTPAWSDLPLLKSHERTKPPLGWPRETDSLCPVCVREARTAILDGRV